MKSIKIAVLSAQLVDSSFSVAYYRRRRYCGGVAQVVRAVES